MKQSSEVKGLNHHLKTYIHMLWMTNTWFPISYAVSDCEGFACTCRTSASRQSHQKEENPLEGPRVFHNRIDVYTKRHQNTPKVRKCQKAWQWFFTINPFSHSAVGSHFHHRKSPCAFTNIRWASIDHQRIGWSTWIARLQFGSIIPTSSARGRADQWKFSPFLTPKA